MPGSCFHPVPVHGQIVMRAATGAEGGAEGWQPLGTDVAALK